VYDSDETSATYAQGNRGATKPPEAVLSRPRQFAMRFVGGLFPRLADEVRGGRVVFERLHAEGFFNDLRGKRVLEVGPKHGRDSLLLAGLQPTELVLIDLPEKNSRVGTWFPDVASRVPARYIEGNLLYLPKSELRNLGAFDLVWCLGVLYHNAEQLRLLRRLYNLCNAGGTVVLESEIKGALPFTDPNVVDIYWPKQFHDVPTITHLPSRRAIASWMEMVGFSEVQYRNVLTRVSSRKRAVLTGIRKADDESYVSYASSGLNPLYRVGEAD
jgi:SAM-dependent methyltransferase